MCNIIVFEPKAKIPYEKLENCVFNNPHGFGLLLKDNNRLELIRECSEKGNDPEKIARLLEENEDIERFLHVRWKTNGPIDMDNTHPFCVFHTDKRQIQFMHNGTLSGYGGVDKSDTKDFAEKVLQPLFSKMTGLDGKGDIHDPFVKEILSKFWTGTNKGLLISNDQDPIQLGYGWKTFGKEGEPKYEASNDTYFDKVTRGPVFLAREEAKKRIVPSTTTVGGNSLPSTDTNLLNGVQKLTDIAGLASYDKSIVDYLDNAFDSHEIWEDHGLAELSNLTDIEIEKFVTDAPIETLSYFMVWFMMRFTDIYNQLGVVEHKHDKATKIIAELRHKYEPKNEEAK